MMITTLLVIEILKYNTTCGIFVMRTWKNNNNNNKKIKKKVVKIMLYIIIWQWYSR